LLSLTWLLKAKETRSLPRPFMMEFFRCGKS
jgi:hypothetical protein